MRVIFYSTKIFVAGGVIILSPLPAPTSAYGGNECTRLPLINEGGGISVSGQPTQRLRDSTSYCLQTDMTIKRRFVISEGGEKSFESFILSVQTSGILVNLQGHSLNADALGSGGVNGGLKKITLENGTIKSRTASGVEFGGLFGNYFGSIKSDFSLVFENRENSPIKSVVPTDSSVLRTEVTEPLKKMGRNIDKTENNLFSLNIEVGAKGVNPKRQVWQNGVAMKGAANTIRNCIITVNEGHAGIYLFGPNQIIEKNTLIFKGRPATESGAPIKIHLADNSIIRHNTIIIEGWGEKPDAAISVIDSKNVLIENNKIIGTQTLYKVWDEDPSQQSSVIEHGNEFISPIGRLFGQ